MPRAHGSIGFAVAVLVPCAILAGSVIYAVASQPDQSYPGISVPTDDPAKASLVQRINDKDRSQLANAPRSSKPTDYAATHPVSPCIPEVWDEGVFYQHQNTLPTGAMRSTSVFEKVIDSTYYTAYVGADYDSPVDGLIIVQTFSLCGRHIDDEEYAVPGAGSLTITSASGTTMYITSDKDVVLSFDLTNPIPIIQPGPGPAAPNHSSR